MERGLAGEELDLVVPVVRILYEVRPFKVL